jgi:hypothetical protein
MAHPSGSSTGASERKMSRMFVILFNVLKRMNIYFQVMHQ